MQGKPAIAVDNGVAGVGASLKADDDIGLFGQQIGDFALALVAPVGAYNCFYHILPPGAGIRSRKGFAFSGPPCNRGYYTPFCMRLQGEKKTGSVLSVVIFPEEWQRPQTASGRQTGDRSGQTEYSRLCFGQRRLIA